MKLDIGNSNYVTKDYWGENPYTEGYWAEAPSPKRTAHKYKWHDWFAWSPVFARDATTNRWKLVWLETVQRRRVPTVAGVEEYTGYWVHKQKATA